MHMTAMKNIMTIDLEAWYNDTDFGQWYKYEDRIYANTQNLLSILEKGNARATFFVLGYIAERFPELIKKISSKGHEIAIHGYIHQSLSKQSPDEFEKSLVYSQNILEEIIHKKIIGFRAPFFSLNEKNQWALPIISRNLQYDSSIVPARTPLYGWPNSPRIPHQLIYGDNTLMEFPITTYQIPLFKISIPVAGGFYLRLFPYCANKYCIKNVNKNNFPGICYIHPWEIDPQQPRINANKWWHYYNIKMTRDIFARLLADFKFQSISDYLKLNHIN